MPSFIVRGGVPPTFTSIKYVFSDSVEMYLSRYFMAMESLIRLEGLL